MEHIKRFFECLIPVTSCNMKCSYCYIIQRDNRKMQMPKLKYSPEIIGKGLTKERLGGVCYFSICGAGETLLPEETIEIVEKLLENGHYVNITTNGTLTKRFDQIIQFPEQYLQRLHIAFSFHYLELKRMNQIDRFFENIHKVKNAGASFLVQINLCDEYIPFWDEIKNVCIENVGAPPQVAATRKEIELEKEIELMTQLSTVEYEEIGNKMNSPLFKFTMKNFNKVQNDFCYAGDWSGTLNLGTGILTRCYGSSIKQDIFKDINSKIDFCAMGNHCRSRFCMNSSHFLSLGVIPSIDTPTYAELRNRETAVWYSNQMKEFLSGKLEDENDLYTKKQLIKSNLYNNYENIIVLVRKTKRIIKRLLVKSK